MVTWIGVAAFAGLGIWFVHERGQRRTHPMPGGLRQDIALPHTGEFELYHNAFSLCSKKVRMCLAELNIPYVSHHIDLIETGSYETLSRRFLAVNPAALVPVLVHNGHPIYESHEIITYAAEHSGSGERLTPSDPATRAVMQEWIHKSSLYGDEPTKDLDTSAGNCVPGLTVPLFAAMIRYIPVHRIVEGLLFHRIKSRPLSFLMLKLNGLARLGKLAPARRVIIASRRRMARHLDDLEQQLASSGGAWITGTQFTLADVSWTVIFDRLREADWLDELVVGQRPRVADYWAALQARPSYRSAMLEHQHPLVQRGTADIVAEKTNNAGFRNSLYAAR